jgi:WD40 repeat protein
MAQNRPETLWLKTGFISYVESVAVSPDGQTLAVAGDTRIDLYRLSDGVCLRTLTGRGSAVRVVAWSPDGTKLVGCGYNGQVWLYRASDGALIAQAMTNTRGDGCTSVAFSPDGQNIATASPGNVTLEIWRASDLGLARRLPLVGAWCVAYSPDGATLAVGFADKRVRVVNAATGDVIRTLGGHTNLVRDVAFSPDGATVASASDDKTARLWNAGTGALIATLSGHTWTIDEVAFSSDGTRVVTASWDGDLRVWQADTGTLVRAVPTGAAAMAACFSENGSKLFGSLRNQRVAEWDVADGSQTREFTMDQWGLNSVAVNPAGDRVAALSASKLCVFGLADGQLQHVLPTYGWPVGGVAWSPDGALVYGMGGVTLMWWDTDTGASVGGFTVDEASLNCSAISRNASHVAVCATDGTVAAYDLTTSTRLWGVASAGADPPSAITFAPDATLVADIADPGVLEVWRVSDGASVLSLAVPSDDGRPTAVTFAPDGLEVAVGTNWGRLLFVDVATGSITRAFSTPGTVYSVAYTPDGSRLIIGFDNLAMIVSRSDGRVLATYAEEMQRGAACTDFNAAGTIWCYGRADQCLVAATMPTLTDPTSITMSGAAGMVGSSVTLSAELTSGGAPLAGREVHFWSGTAWWESAYLGSAVTDATGVANLAWSIGPPAEVQRVCVAFGGSGAYQYSDAIALVTAVKPSTRLFTFDRLGAIDTAIAMRGHLSTGNYTPIVRRTLSFTISGTVVGTAETDIAGRATLWYVLPNTLAPGQYPIGVSFAGDATFPAASAAATLTVTKGEAYVWVMPRSVQRGTAAYMRVCVRSARLLVALPGLEITHTLDGTPIGSATTNAAGWTALLHTVPASTAPGDQLLTCSFSGNGAYLPAGGSATITVTP